MPANLPHETTTANNSPNVILWRKYLLEVRVLKNISVLQKVSIVLPNPIL